MIAESPADEDRWGFGDRSARSPAPPENGHEQGRERQAGGSIRSKARWCRCPPPVPAYATTVHKAQGSEYPVVVVPLVTQML